MKVPVLVPKIFNFPFTYDSGSLKDLIPGDIVIVPFGRNEEIGVVWDKIQPSKKKFKIKKIIKKIENFKINKDLIKFVNWLSAYNLASKGMVLRMCLGEKKNAIIIEKKAKEELIKKSKFTLNKDQKKSLGDLKKFGNKFNVSLLQGVTGSGKTLVYFERVKEILNLGKQVLILLPEIFLTNQFKDRYIEFFGYEPSIWHSKIGIKSKRKIWQSIIDGNLNLVIGARSSLLLPFKNLGLIVLDEEHDPSYKQDEGIIYHARDMAIARASIEKIPIHLVSAVPSLETYNNVKTKKYNYTKLTNRYSDFPLPEAKVINLEKAALKSDQFIADETLELIDNYLKKKEQVLFFLNRRGYSPFLICKKCGFKHLCPNCSIYLTFHKLTNQLICHHCGKKIKKEKICSSDEENCDFRMYGPGVEKIYDELKKIFPKKNIKIFSSDFLFKKNETESFLKKIEKNEIDIIIGTQLISKGFNFPKLNCIVVVDADFSGMGYDLRTTEKNIQLYNQLSGRAGRFSNKSLIIYQTITPLNETLQDVLENNPEKFLNNELIVRKNKNLPPFSRLISLIISSNSSQDSFKAAQEIKRKLTIIRQIEVLGPVDSPIFKIKKKYRTRLLLRSKNANLIQKDVGQVLQNLTISKKIKLTVDVDPINFA
ncbi:MAG: primosomal protein N' [Pelagibacteraceae bacterium]|jgi:primosomal protein N' (replication factor Y) (superfamily II helicase)|nr:primosomal protein N' [Pelagibacteraceae bacterium]